ncbi:MAG: methyltransferase domain-containing protein [Chloroflexi bacterium]|nr:methyltransferase domain-containing protein [Chloroflexota bacterium]
MKHLAELSASVKQFVRCPICNFKLKWSDTQLECVNNQCATMYPIINGIPVLINEHASIFSINDFINRKNTTFSLDRLETSGPERVLRTIKEYTPRIVLNFKAEQNYAAFAEHLKKGADIPPKILVIGGAIEGKGISQILSDSDIEVTETDVSFGPRTRLICDAHDIPFDDETFDGVVAQAVLEHVIDPYRCAEEIYRVTKLNGLVYSDTPFMYPVHMGRYDFTRFTHLGHRRLFRKYVEIDSGPIVGSGTALALSYFYFLMSFCTSRFSRALFRRLAKFTAFWLQYFDYYLIDKPGSYDAAAAFFFLGRKKKGYVLGDRELLEQYRGLQ